MKQIDKDFKEPLQGTEQAQKRRETQTTLVLYNSLHSRLQNRLNTRLQCNLYNRLQSRLNTTLQTSPYMRVDSSIPNSLHSRLQPSLHTTTAHTLEYTLVFQIVYTLKLGYRIIYIRDFRIVHTCQYIISIKTRLQSRHTAYKYDRIDQSTYETI